MRGYGSGRSPLSMAISQLYGYIFCMLASYVLVGMPLFGGALYLSGCAAEVLAGVYSRKNRRYLPAYTQRWGVVLFCVLLLISGLLMGLYPAGFESPRVWVVFASVALCLCADGCAARIRRLRGRARKKASGRAWAVTFLLQALIVGAEAVILLENMERHTALELTGAFALLTVSRGYSAWRLYTAPPEEEAGETDEEDARAFLRLPVYRTYETLHLILVAAVELTLAALYALLAAGSDQAAVAIAVGMGASLAAYGGSMLFLRRSARPNWQDPTWLLCVGLAFWLGGVALCGRVLRGADFSLAGVYGCLALCSVGGALCLSGTQKIEELLPQVARATDQPLPQNYARVREAQWDLAQLLGDLLALVALSVFCFVNGSQLPRDMRELAARFQPIMFVPLLLVMLGAWGSALRFPLSARYIDKLRRLLHLQEQGEENPALRRQVERVVVQKYRQPWLTRFLEAVLRPFYRHTLVDADHIETDDSNPLVFVCNHGEIYGPIVCALYMPVHFRAWTISMMMIDQAEITAYMYENTFSRKTALPVFVRRALAGLLGWLSVRVMNQLENIPVYRDSPMKLRETVRQSIEAMESGDNLLIFPENPETNYVRQGIGRISPGFVMLGQAYWQRCGKRLRVLPMYANREKRTITFGRVITYTPENGFRSEQDRIVREVAEQIGRMAETAPKEEETER